MCTVCFDNIHLLLLLTCFDLHWVCFNITALPVEHLLFSCNSLKLFNVTITNYFSGSFKSPLFYVIYWCFDFNPLLCKWSSMNPTAVIDT